MGPRFNSDSCASCHSQPAVGGTNATMNPLIAIATRLGANNFIPFFITPNGPIREARFKFNDDGSRDGNVHRLFVISGRSDAPGCNIRQFDFQHAPIFGLGLIEAIPDSAILANKNAHQNAKRALGISGHENRNPNDNTITKFGWKAKNKSGSIFAGEAYNHEMGVSNELFSNERDDTPQCLFNGIPEDHFEFDEANLIDQFSDVQLFTEFMRFSAPPTPAPATPSTNRGANIFTSIGCTLCHTPSLTTAQSSSPALSNVQVKLFSDLLLHDMGDVLRDDILQGNADGDEFRNNFSHLSNQEITDLLNFLKSL